MASASWAQTFSDNFDSYTANAFLAQSNSAWKTWTNKPGGSDDVKISSAKATGYEIFQGKGMDFSSLIAGSYIIQIESEKYRDALKFLKAN